MLKMRLHRLVLVYSCQMTQCWKSHVAAQVYEPAIEILDLIAVSGNKTH